MRPIVKNLASAPARLSSPEAQADMQLILSGNLDAIRDLIYKDEYKDANNKSQSRVRDALNVFYHEKCAYCETLCKAEIEHYRPKKGVTGEAHVGYYWLCYEWTNLLPSCRYCNTEGGKGNKFPLRPGGTRVATHPVDVSGALDPAQCQASHALLKAELPYLLHPEIDRNFDQYFRFTLSSDNNGVDIVGIDADYRGTQTIAICNLNRNTLRLHRLQNVFETMKSTLNIVFAMVESGLLDVSKIGAALRIAFKNIEDEANNDHKEHTLLRKHLISSDQVFETAFVPYMDIPNQRIIVTEAFKQYKQGTLN